MTTPRLTCVLLLLGLAASASATEVLLRNGTLLTGEVVGQDERSLTIRVPLIRETQVGRIEGSVDRRVPWTQIETIDGLDLASWLRSPPSEVAEVLEGDPPSPGYSLRPREGLERFRIWLETGQGLGVGLRLVALALLIVVPGLLVLLAARVMKLEHIEGFRSFGGAALGLAAGSAVVGVWPGWIAGWPLAAMGATGVATFVVIRPPLAHGLGLVLLALAGIGLVVQGVPALLGAF